MNCQKAGVECRVVPPAPPRRRKKRLQEKDLLERLRKYERLLNEHGIEFDAIGQDSRLDDVEELGDDFEGLRTSAEASPPPSSVTRPDEWVSVYLAASAPVLLVKCASDLPDLCSPFTKRSVCP